MDLTLLLPLALLVLMIFFMWRSNKKRTAQQTEMRQAMQPGVEVMTQAGIFGTLVSIDQDSNVAVLETSPGVELRVHSQTIAHVVPTNIEVPDDASALTGDANLASGASTTDPVIDRDETPTDNDIAELDAEKRDEDDTDTDRPKA